jgi:hypothetical protein
MWCNDFALVTPNAKKPRTLNVATGSLPPLGAQSATAEPIQPAIARVAWVNERTVWIRRIEVRLFWLLIAGAWQWWSGRDVSSPGEGYWTTVLQNFALMIPFPVRIHVCGSMGSRLRRWFFD